MADNIGIMDSTGNVKTVSAKDASSVFHQRFLVEYNDTTPAVVGVTTPLPVAEMSSASGGLSVICDDTADEAVFTVKNSAGRLKVISIASQDAAVLWLQLFDESGAITVGTTVPKLSLPIPVGSGSALTSQPQFNLGDGIAFTNTIKAAVTTTRAGATGPTADLVITYLYK